MNAIEEPDQNIIEIIKEPPHSFVERFLSPQSLQRMMACGGGLLVLGFVAWLWSIGLFSSPIVVALIIGAANLGTLAAGIGLVKYSRHQLAGQGLTLLGALALPLNLWFYDAQGLITLAGGGHLWIPAAICCMLYAGVAWVLRDARFVYTFIGGIVLTGMLFLADRTVNQFWSLMPQVTFLASVGWLSIFAERQFPISEGDFSRQKFGRAFLRCGLIVLGSGLVLLLGAQAAGILNNFLPFISVARIATHQGDKLWALAILVLSTAGFAFAHVSRKSDGRYGVAAVGLGLWSGVSLLDVLDLHPTLSHIAIGAAVLVIAVNLLRILSLATSKEAGSTRLAVMKIGDASMPMSVVLILLALVQFIGQFFCGSGNLLFSPTGWTLLTQLGTTTAAVWTTSTTLAIASDGRKQQSDTAGVLFQLGAVTATLAAGTFGLVLAWSTIVPFAIVTLATPIAASITACLAANETVRRSMRSVASMALVSSLVLLAVFCVSGVITVPPTHLMWSGILAVSAAVWFLAAASRGAASDSVAGFLAASGSIWQMAVAAGIDPNYALVAAPTLVGSGMAIFRLLFVGSESDEATTAQRIETTQNTLVILGNLAGGLLAVNRVLVGEEQVGLLGMLAVQLVGTAIVGLTARRQEWRLAFRAAACGLVLSAVFVLNGLLSTHWLHRVEISSLLAGATLLTLGYIAWSREGDQKDGMATAGFSIGSLLTVIPLSVGLVYYRMSSAGFTGWTLFHEVGVIIAGLILLGSGLLTRIRSTTIAGSALLAVHVLSLVTLIRLPDQLQSVSVVMMVGGAIFFGTAVLLSIYRDRLLAIPEQMRRGHGIFQVLKWR